MQTPRWSRIALLLAASFLTGATRAAAQETIDSTTRAELIEAREAVWRAFFQGDSLSLARLLPSEMVAMGTDRDRIIADARAFARSGARYRGMEFSDESFFRNGDTAILWSHYVAHLVEPDGTPADRRGRAIELFVRVNGRWINPHWHLDSDR